MPRDWNSNQGPETNNLKSAFLFSVHLKSFLCELKLLFQSRSLNKLIKLKNDCASQSFLAGKWIHIFSSSIQIVSICFSWHWKLCKKNNNFSHKGNNSSIFIRKSFSFVYLIVLEKLYLKNVNRLLYKWV